MTPDTLLNDGLLISSACCPENNAMMRDVCYSLFSGNPLMSLMCSTWHWVGKRNVLFYIQTKCALCAKYNGAIRSCILICINIHTRLLLMIEVILGHHKRQMY
jgi:hypothetical protein